MAYTQTLAPMPMTQDEQERDLHYFRNILLAKSPLLRAERYDCHLAVRW